MRLFPLLLLALFAVGQQSQPLSTTPPKTAHTNKGRADLKKENAAPNDQITRDLMTAINQLTAAVEAQKQQGKTTQANSGPPVEHGGTILATVFTGALVLLAALQFWAMHRQANISDRLAGISHKQREVADKQREIAAEQLAITKANESRREIEKTKEEDARYIQMQIADKKYLEQLTLAKDNAYAAKKSAVAAVVSARALTKNTEIQAASLQQWIRLGNWRFHRNPVKPELFHIGFDAINPTGKPLTLHALLIELGGEQHDPPSFGVLAPDNPLIVWASVQLTPEQQAQYAHGITVDFECSALFADCLGVHWQQIFGRQITLVQGNTAPVIIDSKNILRQSGVKGATEES
jgi:hypothetical protein